MLPCGVDAALLISNNTQQTQHSSLDSLLDSCDDNPARLVHPG
jgi:hypothetical protein